MSKKVTANFHYKDLSTDQYMVIRFKQNAALIKSVFDNKKQKLVVLDLGGYMGDTYFELVKQRQYKDIEWYVVDYDSKALEIAKKRGCKIQKSDLNFLDLKSLYRTKKFDLIVCTEVLEHLLNPRSIMDDFRFLLKPEGYCLISLPNENTIFHRIYSAIGLGVDQFPFDLYKHLHFPTLKQSQKFVEQYFRIYKKEYYINFGGKASRFAFLGYIFNLIPVSFWRLLSELFPSLLARGTIFLLKK